MVDKYALAVEKSEGLAARSATLAAAAGPGWLVLLVDFALSGKGPRREELVRLPAAFEMFETGVGLGRKRAARRADLEFGPVRAGRGEQHWERSGWPRPRVCFGGQREQEQHARSPDVDH